MRLLVYLMYFCTHVLYLVREADVKATPSVQALKEGKSEKPAVVQDVRRNGMLLFSDMIIEPHLTTARMASRRKHTNINVKIECMSDEEDKFVDEAARRAAASAALRLREQHEAGQGAEEEVEEEEVEEEEEEEEEEREGGARGAVRVEEPALLPESGQAFSSAVLVEMGTSKGTEVAVGAGVGVEAGVGVSTGLGGKGVPGKAPLSLPTWEARDWENDILWGNSSDEEEGAEVDVDAEGEQEKTDDSEAEFDEDEFEAELDVEGGGDDAIMRDHFDGGGGGGVGGSGPGGNNKRHGSGGGGGGGSGGGKEGEDEDDKRRKVILERIAAAKRYFVERENLPFQNAVRIGEYNEALEEGSWVRDIIWSDMDRRQKQPLALKRGARAMTMTLRRPVKGKDCGSILGQTTLAPHESSERAHACIPPWWLRRGPYLQARHVPMLDELVERLDVSRDNHYLEAGGTKARIKLGRPSVLHAPATRHLRERRFRNNQQEDSYRTDFHRNRIFRDPKASYTITFTPQVLTDGDGGAAGLGAGKDKKEVKGAEEKIQALKHLRDVTVKDGKHLLVEHLEDCPPLISNPGMASRIKHYYRCKPDQPPPTISNDVLADGKPVGLDAQQESPFFDDLPEGPQAYVSALENNMLRHPIAKHTPAETDFLVVCKGDKYYLRPINSLYCAGQCHPFLRVPAPNSKEREKYTKRHLVNFIYGRLSNNGSLCTHEVFDEFPATSETAIRKQLKDCAQFNREGGEGGHWTLKDGYKVPEDIVDEADTPDMVCLHESLQAGQMRLRNQGVKTLHRGDDVTAAVTEITKDKNIDPVIRHGALCVQELLWRAPWNQSANFVQALDHRQPLNLSTVVGSRKAIEVARRDELMTSQRADVKEQKKAAAEYSKRRQTILQEMLETISQQEADSSSDEENSGEPYDEDGGQAAHGGGFGINGRQRFRKITIAHRWCKESTGSNELRWTCSTIRNADEVAKIVSDKKKRKPSDVEDHGALHCLPLSPVDDDGMFPT
jgi:hypothetical protein